MNVNGLTQLICPEHIHAALRKLAGIDEYEFSKQFPLAVPDQQMLKHREGAARSAQATLINNVSPYRWEDLRHEGEFSCGTFDPPLQ